jgi:hypothetical protein
MDYAWYGPLTPAGLFNAEDDARTQDGPFELSLTSGSLTVEFDDLTLKAEAHAVGHGYVEELALGRARSITWSPLFRSPSPVAAASVREGYADVAGRFGLMRGKTVTRANGGTETVRADSIDAFRAEPCVRSNVNLRAVRAYLAASLEDPRHEDLQRAHDRLRNEIAARNGLKDQHARDQALAALVGQPASWSADIGQSLEATRHVRGTPKDARLTQTECARRLGELYAAAVIAWCPDAATSA